MIETPTAVPGSEAELGGGALASSPSHRLAHRADAPADAAVALVDQIAEPDRAEERVVPATDADVSAVAAAAAPPSWPRYVHLHTVVQSERTSAPVAR